MKDWKDPDQYPAPNTLTTTQWAWEFLRRNKEYQADWDRELEAYLSWRERGCPDEDESLYDRAPEDPADPDFRIFTRARSERALERWGLLAGYLNPATDRPTGLWSRWMFSTFGPDYAAPFNEALAKKIPIKRSSVAQAEVRPGQVAIVFEIAAAIEPQLKDARILLERTQKAYRTRGLIPGDLPRRQQKKWPLYLRILDAVESGAKQEEIAAVLFPDLPTGYPDREGQKAVSRMLGQARKLVDGGYRRFLA